jgi:hypothetical protein
MHMMVFPGLNVQLIGLGIGNANRIENNKSNVTYDTLKQASIPYTVFNKHKQLLLLFSSSPLPRKAPATGLFRFKRQILMSSNPSKT